MKISDMKIGAVNFYAMKILALAAVALTGLSTTSASAQSTANYPDRPVRVIVPFPAGAVTDIITRLIAQKLSVRLSQQFLVENRTGASGNIGADAVAKATPDGHTMGLITASTHGVAPALGGNLT